MGDQVVYSLASGGNNIFAGSGFGNGVYLSTNNGTNWTQTSLNNRNVNDLAVNGNYVFAGAYGVYLSTNNGASWTLTSLNNRDVYSLAVNGNYVFAGTGYYGVYRSTDYGASWNQAGLNGQDVYSLAINGNYVFAGTGCGCPNPQGVYLSTDNGTTWNQTSLNNRNIYSLAANGNNIFAGTNSYGLYLSTNNGTTWTHTSLNAYDIGALALDGNNVFAGAQTQLFFVSNDNGTSWTPRNEGGLYGANNALSIMNNYIFYGGTHSVWRRPLSELVGIQPIPEQIPSHYALEQNYPNPFNPSTNFKFQIAKLGNVKIVIYDALGKEIETLVNAELNPGTYEVDWDATNYPSGIYFYTLTAGDFSETKKMVLIK